MRLKLLRSAAVLLALGTAGVPLASAQQRETDQDVVIITGTRVDARSAIDSPAPVDVVSGVDLVNQGDNDAMNIIRTLVPSFNVTTQPISDAATLVRPVNLRGLSPDSTLVLVNGKRMHRAAVIAFLGGGISDGSQGADISTIPAIALKQVEVLRDGASSQYGSDAIAGVASNAALVGDRTRVQCLESGSRGRDFILVESTRPYAEAAFVHPCRLTIWAAVGLVHPDL